jgi:hypothetical protein
VLLPGVTVGRHVRVAVARHLGRDRGELGARELLVAGDGDGDGATVVVRVVREGTAIASAS